MTKLAPSVTELLNNYTRMVNEIDNLKTMHEKAVHDLIPPELQTELDALTKEFEGHLEFAQEKATAIADDIKLKSLPHEETIKGDGHMAVYSAGREKWDSKMLEGIALVAPIVMKAKTPGTPYISIKKVAKKKGGGA